MAAGPKTVLILDDDEGVSRLERRQLERSGLGVLVAEAAADARAAIDAGGIDLLLLDYRLRDNQSGLDFYRELKAAGRDLPVILVTGFSQEAVAIEALRAGVRDFITKSAEYLEYLPEAVENVLAQVALEQRLTQSEAELRASNERFQLAARATSDAMWDWNLVSGEIWTNGNFDERFGALGSPGAINDWTHRLHPADRRRVMDGIFALLANSQSSWSEEYRFRRADGSYARILDRGHVIYEGERPVRMLASMVDLTAYKQAEERIRCQAMFLDKAHDAIVVQDLVGRITYWNQGAERLYGWRAAEAEGRRANEIFCGDSAALDHAEKRFESDGEWVGELHQLGKAGNPIIVESRWTLVHDETGQPTAKLTINTDITEKKTLEEQFRHAQRMESIGTLAGGVAHEFNNLLQAIQGYTRFAREGLDPADQRFQDLDEVLKASERAAALTRQLLTFSRRQPMTRAPHDLNAIVRDLSKMIRPLIGEHIDLTVVLAESLGLVQCDVGQIHQVLLNLCLNARDAMPSGGQLTLRTEPVTLSEAYCRVHGDMKPGEYVRICVTDTGCGMEPNVRMRIFEPFFTTKPVGKGTGLGLAAAYGIVEQHEGTIQVYSEPGKGTIFKVYLPRMESGSVSTAPEQPGVPARGTETILVAEDEPLVRHVALRILQEAGYRTVVACDGAEAVRLFEINKNEISLVLLDAVMPKLGGHEAYEKICQLRPGMPTVFSSGYDCDPNRITAGSDGTRFLQKPFDPHELLKTVREAIDSEHSAAAASTGHTKPAGLASPTSMPPLLLGEVPAVPVA